MKNKMMRIASILMVAVLLTVCAVSSTFAKYVTTANASDTARVAKWGIIITQEGDGLFATQYAADDDTYNKGEYTVISSNEDKVVAPGTTNADSPLKFSIKGTPEVAVRVKVELAKGYKEVVLPAGTYTDYTKAQKPAATETTPADDTGAGSRADTATEGTFTLAKDYYPVVFKLYEGEVTDTATPIAEGKLADIETFLNTYSTTADYAPGTVFNTNFSLIWEWKFEELVAQSGDAAAEADPTVDAADTFLGNIAAGVVEAPTGACTDINFALTITVTQID